MTTAALYIRVSTEDQTEYSPDAQKRLLLEYASKNTMTVHNEHIYIDEGISGRKAEKRPAFMKMITTAKKTPKPFDIILVHRFDRFSRSREDSIVYKSLLRKECDIKVISITEQMEDDKFSVILEAMLEAMAEYYSLNLADEVMKGMTQKALNGGYQSSPPLGYEIIHSGEIPTIVNNEAEIVKLIFHKYVYDKMTYFQIAKYLNAFGLKTKLNNNFERRSVEYIINNPMYMGYIRWNRTHNATNTLKNESEWIIEKGQHTPIISEELYELAQERAARDHSYRKARPVNEYKHWLSGLIKCGYCGRTMTASYNNRSKRYYFQCNGYLKGKCSQSNSISEMLIQSTILTALENVLSNGTYEYELKVENKSNELFILQQQLYKLSSKEDRIRNAYISGVDSLDEYTQNKNIILKEKGIIINQLKELETELNIKSEENIPKSIKTIYDLIKGDNTNIIQKNQIMKSIIEKIVYHKNSAKLEIYFKL